MARTATMALTASFLSLLAAGADDLLVDGFESTEGWRTGNQKEIRCDLSSAHVKEGKHALHLHVEIDHRNAEQVKKVTYPMGWPSVTKEYSPGLDLSAYDFLEFDVYFESRRGRDPDFALSVIAKDSHGAGLYQTALVDLRDRKWAHEKLCIRGLPAARDFAYLHFFLSESSYDHGDVIDFFIDNLRATTADDYEQLTAVPFRHAIARTETALLWVEGPARKVMRAEDVELPGANDPRVIMSAARNETEAVQVIIRPLTPQGMGEVSVIVGSLTGPGGATIAAENVSWSPVGYVPAREAGPEGLPDGLIGPKPFTADKQQHYPIWLEVYVPPETVSGDYAAPIIVRTSRGDLRAELQLHVWDFDIPVRQHLRTSTTIYGPYGWRDDIKEWYGSLTYGQFINEWRPKIVELLGRYRLSPSHLRHLPLRWDTDTKKVILGNTVEFEQFVERYLAMGHRFDSMPVPYFFDRKGFLGADKGTPEYLSRITEAYRTAATYLEAKGWLEDTYVYCVDEVVCHKHSTVRDFNLLNQVFDAIHAAHPKIRLFGAETPSPVLRGMNVWCMNIGSFDLDVLQEQHAKGNRVWWYNGYVNPRPGMRISARGVDHRVLFWMNYKYNIDGYLVWTVNKWMNNPWEQPNPWEKKPPHGDNSAGDHFLLYPNPDGTVSPSLRLAMVRDGLEDYEYHWLLADAAQKLRQRGKAGLAEECDVVITAADAFILAPDNCRYIQPSFIYAGRRRLAEQIQKAQAALR